MKPAKVMSTEVERRPDEVKVTAWFDTDHAPSKKEMEPLYEPSGVIFQALVDQRWLNPNGKNIVSFVYVGGQPHMVAPDRAKMVFIFVTTEKYNQ